jgi:hypothetical protein
MRRELEFWGVEVEEKAMDDCDSGGAGGRGGDMGLGPVDEGSTAPLPEKVVMALQKGWLKHWKAACEKNQKKNYTCSVQFELRMGYCALKFQPIPRMFLIL